MSATELQTQMPRRGFTLKARARPALASLSAGFTNSDLALAPMPAIGQLAGKEPEKKKKMTFGEGMKLAAQRAFRGGAAGFAAGVVQVRAFPSQPGARRSATAHAKTTSPEQQTVNDRRPGAWTRGRARPRGFSVSCATANATEARGVRRDATSSVAMSRARRRGARSVRADARKPKQIGNRKARLTGGRPVNAPRADRARRSRTVVFPERFFFTPPQTPLLGPRLSSVSVSRSRSPPRPDARNDASLSKP